MGSVGHPQPAEAAGGQEKAFRHLNQHRMPVVGKLNQALLHTVNGVYLISNLTLQVVPALGHRN